MVSAGGAASLALAAARGANKDSISGTQSNTSMVRRTGLLGVLRIVNRAGAWGGALVGTLGGLGAAQV